MSHLAWYAIPLGLILAHATSLAEGLTFSDTHVDLGRIRAAGTVVQSFRYRVGDDAVEILDVRPSCGCVEPRLRERQLDPGSVGVLQLELKPGSQAPGPKRFSVDLLVRDPAIRQITLAVDAELYSDLVIEPRSLILYPTGKRALRRVIAIRDQRPQPLELTRVVSSTPGISAAKLTTQSDPHVQLVALEIGPEAANGGREQVVRIETTDPLYPSIEVPISIQQRSSLRVLPDRLHVVTSPRFGSQVERFVHVSDPRRQPVVIEVDPAPYSGVTAEVAGNGSRRAQVRLTFALSGSAGLRHGEFELAIHVTEPEEGVVVVPVRVDHRP